MCSKIVKKIKEYFSRLGIIREFFYFIKHRKIWWLVPIIVVLLFLGIVIVFVEGSALAPFIYTLF
ncbi:hypothetical protein J7K70_02545 [bacterium]|nr:hypothetical protein [bacterium]